MTFHGRCTYIAVNLEEGDKQQMNNATEQGDGNQKKATQRHRNSGTQTDATTNVKYVCRRIYVYIYIYVLKLNNKHCRQAKQK